MRRFYMGAWNIEGAANIILDPKGPFCYAHEAQDEIRQLQEANEVLTTTISSYQKGTVELLDKIDKYLAAIKELKAAEFYMKNAQERWKEGT